MFLRRQFSNMRQYFFEMFFKVVLRYILFAQGELNKSAEQHTKRAAMIIFGICVKRFLEIQLPVHFT